MAQVAVEKIDGKKTGPPSFSDEMKALSDRIRNRAFELFELRGGIEGCAVDDWLAAEKELLRMPQSELVEKDGTFKIRLDAPGFEAGDINITAQPDAVVVRASASHKHQSDEENVHFCEFEERNLFRRFDLPHPIALEKVTASLDNGVLQLLAPKAAEEPVKLQPATAKAKTSVAA
jgi:HSP20 family protein